MAQIWVPDLGNLITIRLPGHSDRLIWLLSSGCRWSKWNCCPLNVHDHLYTSRCQYVVTWHTNHTGTGDRRTVTSRAGLSTVRPDTAYLHITLVTPRFVHANFNWLVVTLLLVWPHDYMVKVKVKVNFSLEQVTKARGGRYSSTHSLPRHRMGGSRPRSGLFSPRKEPVPIVERLGGPQGRSRPVRKISSHTRIRSPDCNTTW